MVTTSMTKRRVQAVFLTETLRLVGEVQIGTAGFSGLLNDESTALLEVRDVSVARGHLPNKAVDSYEILRLVKDQVVVVCIKRREDIGPHWMARSGYLTPNEFPVWLSTSAYEVEGVVEWAGPFDTTSLMADRIPDFIPLFDAKATMILVPTIQLESPAAFINRRWVNSLALIKQRQKWE